MSSVLILHSLAAARTSEALDAEPSSLRLSEADLRRWRQCPRRLWLHHHAPDTASLRAVQIERADAGDVGGATPMEALLASWPGARVITPPGTDPAALSADALRQAQQRTEEGLSAHAVPQTPWRPLIGAVLSDATGRLLLRVDLLVPGPRGWKVALVKHATVGHEIDVDQLLLAARLLERQGQPVSGMALVLIDTDFLYPGHGLYAGLYREVDLSDALQARDGHTWPVDMARLLDGPDPATPPGAQCLQPERCPHLDPCLGAADAPNGQGAPDEGTREDRLDIVGRDLAETLKAEGWTRLSDVPEGRLSDPRHLRAWTAVRERRVVVTPGAALAWGALPGPRHFLRFETIGFAIPLWAGTRPYQVLPFQWSLARQTPRGARLHHTHFLARPHDGDPRRAFVESLLSAVGSRGPVFAYNAGFERNRLRELARTFEDHADDLLALETRLVDLFQAARTHLYHPAMAGSWSMRSVLDAIAPELGCGHFEVQGCHSPIAAFARSLQRGMDPEVAHDLQVALIEHGQRQTEGVARLCALLEANLAPT